MTAQSANAAPDGTDATAPETPAEPPRSAQQPPAGVPGSPEGPQGHTEPRAVLAFEVTLRPGVTQDDALAITATVLRALDGRTAETTTVTDVTRQCAQVQHLEEDLRQAGLRADLLRRQVRDLEAERDLELERLRGLLARYARHVELCEGTDFLDREPWELLDTFTPADLTELRTIRREAGLT